MNTLLLSYNRRGGYFLSRAAEGFVCVLHNVSAISIVHRHTAHPASVLIFVLEISSVVTNYETETRHRMI